MKYFFEVHIPSDDYDNLGEEKLISFETLAEMGEYFYSEKDRATDYEVVRGELVDIDILRELDRQNDVKRKNVKEELEAKQKAEAEEKKRANAEMQIRVARALKEKTARDNKERQRLLAIRASAFEKLNDEERALLKAI